MNNPDLDFATRFVLDELNAKERAEAEERVSNDPDFAALVVDLKKVRGLSFHQSVNIAKAAISQAREDYIPAQPKRLVPLAVAASLALLAVIGYYLFFDRPLTNEAYFERHFALLEDLESSRGASSAAGFAAYDAGDWQTATAAFKQVAPTDSEHVVVQVYLGVSYLALRQAEPAVEVLTSALGGPYSDPRHQYHFVSRWYLALAYLLQSEESEAKAQLRLIVGADGASYQTEAKALLAELEQ